MTMPGDLLSGALIEVARDLREKRVTARELIEAVIARHERFGERLHAYSLWAPEQARAVAAAADAAFSAGVTVEAFPYNDIWDPVLRIIDSFGIDRCMWGTDWTRTSGMLTYEQSVAPFRKTDRLSASDKSKLMGGTLQKVYGW
jgi:hypothetical protein